MSQNGAFNYSFEIENEAPSSLFSQTTDTQRNCLFPYIFGQSSIVGSTTSCRDSTCYFRFRHFGFFKLLVLSDFILFGFFLRIILIAMTIVYLSSIFSLFKTLVAISWFQSIRILHLFSNIVLYPPRQVFRKFMTPG